jgi:hypothetical protein
MLTGAWDHNTLKIPNQALVSESVSESRRNRSSCIPSRLKRELRPVHGGVICINDRHGRQISPTKSRHEVFAKPWQRNWLGQTYFSVLVQAKCGPRIRARSRLPPETTENLVVYVHFKRSVVSKRLTTVARPHQVGSRLTGSLSSPLVNQRLQPGAGCR